MNASNLAPTVAVLGEALIDFKATGALAFQGFPGGSPFNVAVAVARLGQPVTFLGQVSGDMLGSHLRAYLAANRVQTEFLLESRAPTTVAFVDERDGNAHFQFMATGAADTLYDPRPRPALPSSVKFIQFGSISLLNEPTATTIAEIVNAHRNGCVVMFDPNCRPALTLDRELYLSRLFNTWLPLAHIVKVSDQDLAWLQPDVPHPIVADDWLARGADAVIVTRGERGASLHRAGHAPLSVPAESIDIVDTVGAGDSFTAACIVRLLELQQNTAQALRTTITEAHWLDVLQFATAVAALNCMRAGANAPQRSEVG